MEELKADGHTVRRVLVVGGGSRNPLLMQLVSDIVGIDQIMPTPAASAAYGDALRAGVGIGAFTDLCEKASLVESECIVRADPEHAAIYDEIYGI